VLPYLHGLHLEAEDALPAVLPPPRGEGSRFRIVVPVLPRISNHTDFDALRLHPGVDFRFIGLDETPPPADLIVLPGSKSVRADLDALRERGWIEHLQKHLRYGGKLLGICGGFQMLGRAIHDPLGIEGAPGSSPGLGWLDMETTLAAEKQLRNVAGRLAIGEVPVSGYEIHAGVSTGPALERPLLVGCTRKEHAGFVSAKAQRLRCAARTGAHGAAEPLAAMPSYGTGVLLASAPYVDGALAADDQVAGTYLHGLFDLPAAADALLAWAGLSETSTPDIHALREAAIERLADAVEYHLDTQTLLHLLS